MRTQRLTRWVLGALLAGAGWAAAQPVGLQVADTAETRPRGEFMLTGGGQGSDEDLYYGLRAGYAVTEPFRIFIDAGIGDTEGDSADLGLQGGGLYNLPIEFVSDLALRLAVYGLNGDQRDVIGGNLLLLSSGETVLTGLYLYAGIGTDIAWWDRWVEDVKESLVDINLMTSGGLLFNITSGISIYAEVTWIDKVYFGGGLRIR